MLSDTRFHSFDSRACKPMSSLGPLGLYRRCQISESCPQVFLGAAVHSNTDRHNLFIRTSPTTLPSWWSRCAQECFRREGGLGNTSSPNERWWGPLEEICPIAVVSCGVTYPDFCHNRALASVVIDKAGKDTLKSRNNDRWGAILGYHSDKWLDAGGLSRFCKQISLYI